MKESVKVEKRKLDEAPVDVDEEITKPTTSNGNGSNGNVLQLNHFNNDEYELDTSDEEVYTSTQTLYFSF